MLIFSHNKHRLKRHFNKDKVLFSYHLGDLDDFYFDKCQWAVDVPDSARLAEVILVYNGCDLPTVLAFGMTDRFADLLEQMIPLLPMKFYCHFQEKNRNQLLQNFSENRFGTFHKMKLENFKKIKTDNKDNIIQLDTSHLTQLKELYVNAYPGNYFVERMLETKKYYGYFDNNKLVSVSGVHVYSDEYEVAVLGNIATNESYRGQGLSAKVTSRLLEDLTADNKIVCLNVKADNETAIALYSKLGFVKVHEYEEALFTLK